MPQTSFFFHLKLACSRRDEQHNDGKLTPEMEILRNIGILGKGEAIENFFAYDHALNYIETTSAHLDGMRKVFNGQATASSLLNFGVAFADSP